MAEPRSAVSLHPLAAIVTQLHHFEIPHMLAGSFASTYHGDPRTTNDIDLVIDPSAEALEAFVGGLDAERFYVSAEAARAAFEHRGQFNVVLLDSGWKADLILRKERPFSRAEFERRQPAEIAGVSVFVATAEDTIIAKLEWARAGESERQLRDVVGILDVSGEHLDREYIASWVEDLDLRALWARANAEAARP
jgi:hypothetical protein